jgi:catechol 2,3-dioxygenase-like lactoylglutathione lyase family enzyme
MKLGTLAFGLAILVLPALANAQLAAPNADGISAGHTHLYVNDVAISREYWRKFGLVEVQSDKLKNLFSVPGMYVLLREQTPLLGSGQTSANHIAFSVKSYAEYKARLLELGAKIILDKQDPPGQILADLPDGVRVEFIGDPGQSETIKFHHTHLQALDVNSLRDWYVKVFGAEAGERAGMQSAVIPGGRIDFLVARGEAPKPSKGNAIDHIGFEVVSMDAFKAKLDKLGIKFDRGPEKRDDLGLTIAFITDPVGTNIEITQGLALVGKK